MNDLFSNHSYAGVRHTSRKAASEVFPKTGTQRRKVYDFIARKGFYGATIDEGTTTLGMEVSSFNPRRRELEDSGLLIDSGNTRKTKKGLDAIVWWAVPFDKAIPLNREIRETSKHKLLQTEIDRLKSILDSKGIIY